MDQRALDKEARALRKKARRTYLRFSVHTLREILPLIAASDESGFATFYGRRVGVSSKRLKTYVHDGTTCHHCGLQATHFAVECQGPDKGSYHLNIYGLNESGHEVMITSDHILPTSRGGSDEIENRQCLCTRCNSRKSNRTEEELCQTKNLIAC